MCNISVKIKYCPSSSKMGEGTLHYQLIQHRVAVQRTTGYQIAASEWNEKKSAIILPEQDASRYRQLSVIRDRLRWSIKQLHRIVQSDEEITANEVLDRFDELNSRQSFFTFMKREVERLATAGKARTAETYQSALRSFQQYRQGEDVMLYELTPEVAEDYQLYLINKGVSMNTVSFYMRILRATLNKAVKQKLTPQTHPFDDVYTGIDNTVKRAIELESIRCIKKLDLSIQPQLNFARDMFMLSFYFRGMSFVNMTYLKRSNLQNGFLTYHRKKTGQQLTIKWEEKMQTILDKYPQDSVYLLPILKTDRGDEREQYKRASKQINRWLRKIGTMAGISFPLTMYVSRHSWASIAKQKNIPIGVISDGLGHDSEKTTQIYLTQLDTSAVDRANSEILADL